MTRLIFMLWLVLCAVPTWAATRYIDDAGSDFANGQTTLTPWKTWAQAMANTSCGDTLIVMDGTYDVDGTHGPLTITKACTAGSPYTVQAQNPRQLNIHTDGKGNAIVIGPQASYIVFDGIRASSAENCTTGSSGSVVTIRWSDHITIKNSLFDHNNRFYNAHLIDGMGVSYSLIEDTELYYFHRHGVATTYCDSSCGPGSGGALSHHNVGRRIYSHNRKWGMSACGGAFISSIGTSDDSDVQWSIYPSDDTILENNIADGDADISAGNGGQHTLFDIQGVDFARRNKFYGNIGLNTQGAYLQFRPDGGNTNNPTDNEVKDLLLVNPGIGYNRYAGNTNVTLSHISILNAKVTNHVIFATDNGLSCDDGSNPPAATSCTASDILLTADSPNNGFGFQMAADSWTATNINAYNFSTNFSPSSSVNYTNKMSVNPSNGACYVFTIDTSPMKGAGTAGTDIGSTNLFAYVDGVLTATKLWDTTNSNRFIGCKAIVAGLNDHAGDSCFDVHERLHVGVENGCALPAGYDGGASPSGPPQMRRGGGIPGVVPGMRRFFLPEWDFD